jgi:hypothetical protein
MQTSKDVVVCTDHCDALSPLQALSLSPNDLFSNFRKLTDLSEGRTVEQHERVLALVDSHMVPRTRLGERIEKDC